MNNFSDYIIFGDESGDHGLKNIDPDYPIFVLNMCLFEKTHYYNFVIPEFSKLKNKYWGSDTLILHEADIRKNREGKWNILRNKNIRNEFLNDLTEFINNIQFSHKTTIINKKDKLTKYPNKCVYEMALLFCMEKVYSQLSTNSYQKEVNIIMEARGNKENKELKLEFDKIMNGTPSTFATRTKLCNINFNLDIQSKKANLAGLQIADLIARPIGINYLFPNKQNRAYEIIKEKQNSCVKTF